MQKCAHLAVTLAHPGDDSQSTTSSDEGRRGKEGDFPLQRKSYEQDSSI